MTKQELSEKLAKAYGVEANRNTYENAYQPSQFTGGVAMYEVKETAFPLIDDTARLMELAFEHDIWVKTMEEYVKCEYAHSLWSVKEVYNDHRTRKDAILWAVGLALLKKAEGSKA